MKLPNLILGVLCLFMTSGTINGFLPRPWTSVASPRPTVSHAKTPYRSKATSSIEATARPKKSRFVTIWIHVMSVFVVINYRQCLPAALIKVPLRLWHLLHGLGAMLFAGSIVTTTLLEWMVVVSKDQSVQRFWFVRAPVVEQALVLPALTTVMVSGVAQAYSSYGTLRGAPRHIKSALHLLLAFGLWWGVTDRTTQAAALQAADEGRTEDAIYGRRRWSNLVSCLFLVGLYAVMILKPGSRM